MKTAKFITLIFSGAISGLVAAFFVANGMYTVSVGQAAEKSISPDLQVYKELYFARIAADIGKNTAILKRIEQGDIKTVKSIVTSFLRADLLTVQINTNYPWGPEQKEAIAAGIYQRDLSAAKPSN
jgi:hypothetical protein